MIAFVMLSQTPYVVRVIIMTIKHREDYYGGDKTKTEGIC